MRRLIMVLLIFGWVLATMAQVVEAAPRGKAFYHGAHTPQHLAVLIERNLAQHPDGRTWLSVKKCNDDGSCAAPIDYLKMIQKIDPGAKLTKVSQLPTFLRSLKMEKAPKGVYWMAYLRPDRTTATGYAPILHGVARHFHKGETVWVDPKTGRFILAQDCTNPIQRPELPRTCVYIYVHAPLKDEHMQAIRDKQYGLKDISSDPCTALLRPGESERESPFVERCPSYNCFVNIDLQLWPKKGWKQGSYQATPGVAILRLPAVFAQKDSPYEMVFCVDGRYGRSSFALGVTWQYYHMVDGKKVAVIYATEAAAKAAHATTVDGKPSDLWWHIPHL